MSPLLKPHFAGNAINHFCMPGNDRPRMSGQFFHGIVLRAVVLRFDLVQILMVVADHGFDIAFIERIAAQDFELCILGIRTEARARGGVIPAFSATGFAPASNA
jgi:hypothetical protein